MAGQSKIILRKAIIRRWTSLKCILDTHFVIDRATECTANIVNSLNPLWNHVPPSGKSITDMLRAIKLQRFRAIAHKNAIQSMRKKGYLSGAWGDNEKLAYIRSTVEEKMDKQYDPATKHPKNWLAFRLCSHPIGHFTGRRLSLQSCVPPPLGQPGNIEVLPTADLQNLKRNSGSSGTVSKGPKKRVVAGSSEGNSTVSNSSFTHTVQLVSNRKDDEELAYEPGKIVSWYLSNEFPAAIGDSLNRVMESLCIDSMDCKMVLIADLLKTTVVEFIESSFAENFNSKDGDSAEDIA